MGHEKKAASMIDLVALLNDCLRQARHLWKLLLVMILIISCLLSFLSYWSYNPVYEASASFTIKVANPLYATVDMYNKETAEQMAKTFPYILTSGVLQQRIRDHLDISYVPEISAKVLQNSTIFTLTVRDSDPQRAYDVLQAAITCYPEISDFVVGPTQFYLLDDTGVPTAPVNSFSLKTCIIMGAAIGIFCWCLFVLISALLKNTVQNEEELRKLLNLPCMACLRPRL